MDLHHVTSVGVDAKWLIEFYTGLLGMRLLLRTVNPDEPNVLQFYCSAADGAPGSILSFLVHPDAPRGRRGNGQVSAVTLAVPPRSLDYWQRRLARSGASKGQARSFGEAVLCFADPDGLELSFEEDGEDGCDGTSPHAIRGIRAVELQVDGFEHTARFLEGPFGFDGRQTEGAVTRFTNSGLKHPVALDLVCTPSHRPGSDGPGVAHHVAWRAAAHARARAR